MRLRSADFLFRSGRWSLVVSRSRFASAERFANDQRRTTNDELTKDGNGIMATATDISILEAQKREPGTKNAARRVRVGGKIPAVGYGAGQDAAAGRGGPRHGPANSRTPDRAQNTFR